MEAEGSEVQILTLQTNSGQSDGNTTLDGSTYPRWKRGCYAPEKNYFAWWKMQLANLLDQWRHLQLTEPHKYVIIHCFSIDGNINLGILLRNADWLRYIKTNLACFAIAQRKRSGLKCGSLRAGISERGSLRSWCTPPGTLSWARSRWWCWWRSWWWGRGGSRTSGSWPIPEMAAALG